MTQGAPTASRPTPQWRRVAAACWLAVWLMAACEQRLEAGTTAPPPGEPSAAAIAELIDDLGAADYHTREAAAAQLKSIGPAAVDALLAAAELAPDLEVALRARWIVDAIPLGMPHDPPEVTQLLDLLKQRRDLPHRLRVMQRLLRLDDGSGIEALARIVRLDRSASGSRIAASLLAREWQADDPAWPNSAAAIIAGLGASTRPTAQFLRSLAGFSTAVDPAARAQHLEGAGAAFELLDRRAGEGTQRAGGAGEASIDRETTRLFARDWIRLLVSAGRRDEARTLSIAMLDACFQPGRESKANAAEAVEMLVWGIENGLPELVDHLTTAQPEALRTQASLGYAAAFAQRSRGNLPQAETLAAAAFARTADKGPDIDDTDRLQMAILLARWGCVDWASTCYTALLDDARTPSAEFALAAILASEFLHEQEREAEAAACLGKLLDNTVGRKDLNVDQILQQLGRDQRTVRSRMHFFESCAARARGEIPAARQAVEIALRSYAKDVDALIALYTLPDNTPDQRADAVRRINEALRQIDNEIQATPEDANSYNEYAWLVANTQGDIDKATRYSKQSLAKSFDSASYLDTLAHCRAAAGDLKGAIRWQMLARRQEPHNRMILANLRRFQTQATAAP